MRPSEKRRNPYLDKILRHSPPDMGQVRTFFVLSFVLAFILSSNDWGVNAFSLVTGLGNLIISFFVVLLSYGAHNAVQRWYAAHRGYQPEHLPWIPGIILGLILALLSNGNILFLAASGITIHHLTVQRLGTFRYGVNVHILGKIALLGLLTTAIIAGIAKTILLTTNLTSLPLYFFTKLYTFNLLFLIWNALPLPPLDGSRFFYWSRMNYVFWSMGALTYFLLLSFGIRSLLLSFIVALIALALYYTFYERHWWNPSGVDFPGKK